MLRFRPIYIGIAAVIAGIVLYGLDFDFFKAVESKTYDLRFKIRGGTPSDDRIKIVAIDARSVDELGRWPWPREKLARVVERLGESGAAVIALDVVFSEPERSCGSELTAWFERYGGTAAGRSLDDTLKKVSGDRLLAESIDGAGNIVGGFYFITSPAEASQYTAMELKELKSRLSGAEINMVKGKPENMLVQKAFDAEPNIAPIAEEILLSGYFTVVPDPDGVIRRMPMVIEFDEDLYAPLTSKVISMYNGKAPVIMEFAEYGVAGYRIGSAAIPTDEVGNMLINYHGPGGAAGGTFDYCSFSDVYYGRTAEGVFEGAVVLIGATETGIYDMRTTPFGTVYPGVEIHANVLSNILLESYVKKGDEQVFIDLLSMIVLGLALGLLLPRFRKALYCALSVLIFMIAYFVFIYFMFARFNMWLSSLFPLVVVLITYTGVEVYRNTISERKAKQIRKTFQNYVSSSVVDEMLAVPDKVKLGGYKQVLTVLFSDIRGFTKISEGADPEEITSLLNSFLTPMTEAIFEYKGTLDKYMGDCIMAIWGAPISFEDHALMACRASIEMMSRLYRFKSDSDSAIARDIDIGIGLNSGEMIAGNMGSDLIMDYTVIGDNVNLASRLEGANKIYRTNIIISENTRKMIEGADLAVRRLDLVRVKGKDRPVGIYELLHREMINEVDCERLVKTFEGALEAYSLKRWGEAEELLRVLLAEIRPGDGPSQVYLERIAYMKNTPPPGDWDGVFEMTTK